MQRIKFSGYVKGGNGPHVETLWLGPFDNVTTTVGRADSPGLSYELTVTGHGGLDPRGRMAIASAPMDSGPGYEPSFKLCPGLDHRIVSMIHGECEREAEVCWYSFQIAEAK